MNKLITILTMLAVLVGGSLAQARPIQVGFVNPRFVAFDFHRPFVASVPTFAYTPPVALAPAYAPPVVGFVQPSAYTAGVPCPAADSAPVAAPAPTVTYSAAPQVGYAATPYATQLFGTASYGTRFAFGNNVDLHTVGFRGRVEAFVPRNEIVETRIRRGLFGRVEIERVRR